jgi:hypothetical protein
MIREQECPGCGDYFEYEAFSEFDGPEEFQMCEHSGCDVTACEDCMKKCTDCGEWFCKEHRDECDGQHEDCEVRCLPCAATARVEFAKVAAEEEEFQRKIAAEEAEESIVEELEKLSILAEEHKKLEDEYHQVMAARRAWWAAIDARRIAMQEGQ